MTDKVKFCELETNSICEVILSDEDASNDGNYSAGDCADYTNNTRQDKSCWSFNESAALIKFIETHYDDLKNPKKKKNMWNLLSTQLESLGSTHTPKQCCEKWKNLLRTYKACKDIKSKSGRGPTRFLYFNLIESFMGYKSDNVEEISSKDVEENNIDNTGLCEDKSCWTFNESAALIHYINSHYEDLQNPKKKKIFWNLLSEELESVGYSHTPKQCCVKWMNLLRTYKTCKEVKTKSGRGPTRFMYFELIDNLLGTRISESSCHGGDVEFTPLPFVKVEEVHDATASTSKEKEESRDSFSLDRDANNLNDTDGANLCGQDKNFWSFNESSALINCVESHFEDMHHPINKKNFWNIISTEFDNLGFIRTGKECCIKWKNLLRTYKTCKDTQSKLGRGPSRFLFYNHLDSFLANKPSNSNNHFVNVEVPPLVSETMDENTSDESTHTHSFAIKRRKTNRTVEEYIELKTKEWEKRRQEKNEERKKRDQRHKEKLELLRVKIELQKQILHELKKQNEHNVL